MMRNNNNNATAQTRVFSASSSSSSSRFYSSSSSSSVLPQTPRRTMEEVWKDLTFSPHPQVSLQNPNPNHPNSSHSSLRGVILQDFLAGPFKETPAADSCPDHNHEEFSLPLPPTALSLNSAFDFEYNNISANSNCGSRQQPAYDHHQHHHHHTAPFVVPHPSAFSDAVIGSPQTVGLFSFCSPNKRLALESSCSGGDRRHKRMMKNRESASRSRARKQAYTNELELEVAHLVAENEKLKKQYEELRLAIAAQPSTKKSLQRTSTAPF